MNDILNQIKSEFISRFHENPLCIFSPGRINLIGEHVDYNEGFVFPGAIDKGIIAAFGKARGKGTLIAFDLNESFEFSTGMVSKQAPGSWTNYILGVVEEINKMGLGVPNFDLVFGGNIPSGAGLSSSAALENSVAFGLNELFDLGLTKTELIHISQRAEHNYAGVKCGIMDQFASMFGKKDRAILLDCRSLKYKFIELPLDGLELILINTNVKHSLAESAYNKRREVGEKAAELLGLTCLRDADMNAVEGLSDRLNKEEYDMVVYVVEEIQRVGLATECLEKGEIQAFGDLLFETHEGLSQKYRVSCEELDFLVLLAKHHEGVIGARLMGGGFGGCTINLVKKNEKNSFIEKARKAYQKNFGKSCDVYEVKLDDGTRRLNTY